MRLQDANLSIVSTLPIVGVGAGGHAKAVIDVIHETNEFSVVGLVDSDQSKWGKMVLDVPVLGNDLMLAELFDQGVQNAFLGIGGVGSNMLREKLYTQILAQNFNIYSPIHPRSVISQYARLSMGVHVMALARINADAIVGNNVIINTGAIVEHDCIIEDHVHIATGATLSGGVKIGRSAHVGSGATIRQSIIVGEGAIIGAGAVVIKDVDPFTTVVGVPARVVVS